MKLVRLLLTLLLIFPVVVFAKVVVKEEPLTWEQSARLPGDQLYQNLCAACHNFDGTGNGIACEALGISAPDLTHIADRNGGVFPRRKVGRLIGSYAHGTGQEESVMPAWQPQFYYVRTGWSSFQREAHARNRIYELTRYLETLQVPDQ